MMMNFKEGLQNPQVKNENFMLKKEKKFLLPFAAKRIEQDQSRNMVELVEMEYKKRVLLNKVLA